VAVIHVGNLIIQVDQWRRLNLIPKVADDLADFMNQTYIAQDFSRSLS
jgi:hypothetical protein